MNLIISPHIDDEVLGCSSILNQDTYVYFCGIDHFHIISQRERINELKDVSRFYKYNYEINKNTVVNNYDCRNFIGIFEDLINDIAPEIIFIPYPSYNQDHQEVYKAIIIALRPHDKNFFVKKVIQYEEPDCMWNSNFEPNYFVQLNINKKIKGYKLHESQVRDHRSCDLLRVIAKERGQRANCDYAESFIIKRWID